jgi:tetratricopeptide (TPR) repeat protein
MKKRSKVLSVIVLATAAAGLISMTPVPLRAQAPAAPAAAGQKNWKDRAEYDMYDAITKDNSPQSRLDKLNQWKEKYPTTDFIAERRTLFLTTYVALNQVMNALGAAKEILANDANDFTALYYITLLTPQIPAVTKQAATADQLADGEKAANALVGGGLDKQFAADKKPANVTDDQWKKARTDIEAVAHTTLGWVVWQQKQYDKAEEEFKKSLSINPANGDVAYYLGTVIAAEKKPEKQSEAFFYFARAAAYDGAGAMNPAGRQQVMTYIKNAYTKYHGGNDKFDELLQTAKSNPAPPAGFEIESVAKIAEEKQKKEEQEAKNNPQGALWKSIREQLQGADGQNYFNSSMKEALLPGGANGVNSFSGKVVSMEPATKPKTVVVAIENPAGDATLKFETALPGKVEPGTVLSFEGVPESFTANPFMVVFNVEAKEHLHGWTGTNPRPAARPRRPSHN